MDISHLAGTILLKPLIAESRRQDQFNVTEHCSVAVTKPWGRQVYGACHRADWYKRQGYAPDFESTLEQARQRAYGDAIADVERGLYKKLGIFVGEEVRFWVPNLYLSGRVDCIIRDPDSWTGGELVAKGTGKTALVGIDIKSTWSYASRGTIDTPMGVKAWPKWEHIIQVAVYHWAFRTSVNYWKLVYCARDSGRTREHTVIALEDKRISVNGEIIPFTLDDVFSRLAQLSKDVQLKEPPARDFELVYDKAKLTSLANHGELSKTDTEKVQKGHKLEKGDWQCGYCSFRKRCWSPVYPDRNFEDEA